MKRFLSILMTLAMLVCMIPAVAFGAVAEETTAWDGTSYDVSWCDKSDSGVEIDGVKYQVTGYSAGKTYEISTAAQLAGLAKLVNAYKKDSFENVTIKLTADIDLGGKTWEMIGKNGTTWNNTYAFAGSFVGAKADGSNAVISNLNIKDGSTSQYTVGLFGLFRGPLMANLTLKNAVIESNYGRTGSFAGSANMTATFKNLISDAKIVMNPSANWDWTLAGGIVGATYNNTTGNTFEGCVFTGEISCAAGKTNVQAYGGIVGVNEGIVKFTDCKVTGTINGAATGVNNQNGLYGIGGILGVARGASSKVVAELEGCEVSSKLSGFGRIGGIIGAAYKQTNTTRTVTLTDCRIDGTVIGSGDNAKTATIGYLEFGATVKNLTQPAGTEDSTMVKNLSYQATAVADGKYRVRFVAEIKGLDWDAAEFGLVATYTDKDGKTYVSKLNTQKVSYCYSSILETLNGESQTKNPDEGYFFLILDVGSISADYTNVQFDLYAAVTDDTGTYYQAVYAQPVAAEAN